MRVSRLIPDDSDGISEIAGTVTRASSDASDACFSPPHVHGRQAEKYLEGLTNKRPNRPKGTA
jgi:hypothetical protein